MSRLAFVRAAFTFGIPAGTDTMSAFAGARIVPRPVVTTVSAVRKASR
ncbi:hypothetical protein ACGFYM_39760 [Streptomyces sp. NPDC048231]